MADVAVGFRPATAKRIMAATETVEAMRRKSQLTESGTSGRRIDYAIRTVELTSTSGSDGTASTVCSYVYTVTDALTGTVLGTGIAPEHNRPYGKTTPATRGVASMNGSTCRLIMTDEIPNKRECT